MKSFSNWLRNLFEGMVIALFHPIRNELPPNIGTNPYKHKPHKKRRSILYS